MTEIFQYLLQSSGILAAFYALYFLLLRNERFFVEIRIYLIMSLILAVFLPFVKIPYTVMVEAVESTVNPEIFVGSIIPEAVAESRNFINIPMIILGLYLLVVSVLLIRSLVKVWQIWSMINGKEYVEYEACKVILLEKEVPAFSFFGYVVINREDFENEELKNIFIHEKVHALQKHWIDLLLVELLSIVFWFNPFVWLFQIAIKQTHELLADDGVIARGFGIGQYQAILINQLMGAEVVGLANNFNHSINKKRMMMMSKEKGPNRRYKLLLMIPLVAAVIVFNMRAVEVQAQDVEIVEIQKNNEVKISGEVLAEDGKPIPGVAVLVEETTVGTVTNIHGKFELQVSEDANVMISFVGLESRKMAVEDFILNGKGKDHFLKIKMKAQKQKMLPVKGSDMSSSAKAKNKKFDPDEIFVIVEKMPKFPGGQLALKKHIQNAIVYPKVAKENGIKGRVFVTFIVTKEGKIGKARVVRGVDPSLDKEALRVIKALPDWTPGEQRGRKVNVSYTIPVGFGVEAYKAKKTLQVEKRFMVNVQTNDTTYIYTDQMPEFPGGQKGVQKYLASSVKYPEVAVKNGITGRVFVTFVVDKHGKVVKARVVRGVDPSLDAEAIRVVEAMPEWKAGIEKGKAVDVSFTVPINFDLGEKEEKGTSKAKGKAKFMVDDMPEFPGGQKELQMYLARNLKYPKGAKEKGIEGRVFVTFIVNEQGVVDSTRIARGVSPLLDEEAMRVVKSMPQWTPGTEKGKPVSVVYTVPISFKLPKETKATEADNSKTE